MERPWSWSGEGEPVADQRRLVLAGLDPGDRRVLDGLLPVAIGATGASVLDRDTVDEIVAEVQRSREAGALPVVLAGGRLGERELTRLARMLGNRDGVVPVIALLPDLIEERVETALAEGCCDVLVRGRTGADDFVRGLRGAFEVARRERAEARLKLRLLEPTATPALLAEARHYVALGRALAATSHELNNLLQPILAYAEMVGEMVGSDTRAGHYVSQIDSSAQLAANLVRRLLETGRDTGRPPGPVEIDRRLLEIEDLIRSVVSRAVEVRVASNAPGAAALLREGALEQVVINLAANARDAMPSGGRLDVATRVEGGSVLIEISDSGGGIAPDRLHQVFEAGYTTKPTGRGSGLGLWIVRGLIEDAGGRVILTSDPGSGTRATIRLPLAAPGP